MAEYIDLEAAFNAITDFAGKASTRSAYEAIWKSARALKKIPAADVAPVVHCKDCKHYLIVDEFEGGKRYMCKVNHFSYLNNDGDMHYCSYGERKEDKDG